MQANTADTIRGYEDGHKLTIDNEEPDELQDWFQLKS